MRGLRAVAVRVLLSFGFRCCEAALLYGGRSHQAYQKVPPTKSKRGSSLAAGRRRNALGLAGRPFRSYFKEVIAEERLRVIRESLDFPKEVSPLVFVNS